MPEPRQSSRRSQPKASRGGTDAPREAAIDALVRQAERYPDLDPTALRTGSLGGRDEAFAHAIYDAAIRRWLTLAYVLSARLRQPFDEQKPGVRGVLLAAAAQMLLLDKVPVHAAINEAVNWSKLRLSGSLAGMVNGVLRNLDRLVLTQQVVSGPRGEISHRSVRRPQWQGGRAELPLSSGQALMLKSEILPEDAWERLRITTSTPQALLNAWRNERGDEGARALAVHGLVEPPTIINSAHVSSPAPSAVTEGPAHDEPGHWVWQGERGALTALLASRTDLWVQDPSSSRTLIGAASELQAAAGSGGMVIDLCAGQGTKTRQLAAMLPKAEIVATDVDERRLESLRRATAQLPNVRVRTHAEVLSMRGAALVLADVPCSNSGVLARRCEGKYRWGPDQTQRLVAIQREILGQAASLLQANGTLIYATCSLDTPENQAQAAWAETALGLTLTRDELRLPSGLPGEATAIYRDGAYTAVLMRR